MGEVKKGLAGANNSPRVVQIKAEDGQMIILATVFSGYNFLSLAITSANKIITCRDSDNYWFLKADITEFIVSSKGLRIS